MLHVPKDEKLSERYSQMVSLDLKYLFKMKTTLDETNYRLDTME